MKTLNLFAVTYNSDSTEGRGRDIVLCRFEEKDSAIAVVSDKRYARYCVMGVHQPLSAIKYNVREENITIFSNPTDFWENTEDERRKKALAKLNPDEIKLLGIKI